MDEPLVRLAVESDLPFVAVAWRQLQGFHASLGMKFPLTHDSQDKWLASFQRSLGRFSFLWVAEDKGHIKAFLLGRIKQSHTYLGGLQIGEISDLFVDESLRSSGVGSRLVDVAVEKFHELKVHSVEVQIQAGNDSGLAFWHKLGFQPDLALVRKMLAN